MTSDDPEFDPIILDHLEQEGFGAQYIQYGGDVAEFKKELQGLSEALELGGSMAIVAYGDAAAAVLEICTKPLAHLKSLIAYYPTTIPSAKARFSSDLDMVVHLAASQILNPTFNKYVYQDVEPGFAEHDLDEYDKVSANLAWSRTLGVLRKGFKVEADLEKVWEEHLRCEEDLRSAWAGS